ncbi:MAG: ankyrin repeat domain-containing protein [Thermodesulfobacteriota bacterium]
MTDEKRINTKQLSEDIRSGLDERTLQRKHRISLKELREFKRQMDKEKTASLESLEHDLRDTVSVSLDPADSEPEARTRRTSALDPDVRDTILMAAMDSKTDTQRSRTTQRLGDVEPDLRETVLIELMDDQDPLKPVRKGTPAKDETPEDLLITIISSDSLDVRDGGDETIRLVDEAADFLPRGDDHTEVPVTRPRRKPAVVVPSEGPAAEIAKTQQLNVPPPPEISLTQPKASTGPDAPPKSEKPVKRSFLGRKAEPPAQADTPKPPKRSLFGRSPKEPVPQEEEKPPKRSLFGRKPKDAAPSEQEIPSKKSLLGRKSPTPSTVEDIAPKVESAAEPPAEKPSKKSSMVVLGVLAVTVVGVVVMWGLFGDYFMSGPEQPEPPKPTIVRERKLKPPALVKQTAESPQPTEDKKGPVSAGLSGREPPKPRDGKRAAHPVRSVKEMEGVEVTPVEKAPDLPAEPTQPVAKAPAPETESRRPPSPTAAPAGIEPKKTASVMEPAARTSEPEPKSRQQPAVEPAGTPDVKDVQREATAPRSARERPTPAVETGPEKRPEKPTPSAEASKASPPAAARSPQRPAVEPAGTPDASMARGQAQERRVAAVPSPDWPPAPGRTSPHARTSPAAAANRMEDRLIVAVRARNERQVRELLDRKVDANSNRNRGGTTALVEAAAIGDLGLARLLMEKGADAHAKTRDGRTPLFAAVTGGHAEMVQFLLDKGADPSAKNNAGISPLDAASKGGLTDVERLLKAKLGVAVKASAAVAPRTPPKEVGKAVHRNERDAYEALLDDSRSVYEAIR